MFIACFELREIANCISLKLALTGQLGHFKKSLDSFHHSPRATNFGQNQINVNKFSTLIPINPLGLIVHGLCFLGVNVYKPTYVLTLYLLYIKLTLLTIHILQYSYTNQIKLHLIYLRYCLFVNCFCH